MRLPSCIQCYSLTNFNNSNVAELKKVNIAMLKENVDFNQCDNLKQEVQTIF